ncbi:ESX secretion-associated protein EspG, partial [Actinoalloteichus caeruleus]|uniref:ESX secretion-associated protein EspG n=1 Tax=Actinoalloteichus cyanogriseus TaxID=2893586 RepID=UPI001B8047D2
MPAQDQVRLSVAQVDSIRVRLGLALPPTLLAGGRGTTQDERRVLLRRAWRELEAERWVDGGEPHPFLHRAFQTLARPAVAVSVAVEEVGARAGTPSRPARGPSGWWRSFGTSRTRTSGHGRSSSNRSRPPRWPTAPPRCCLPCPAVAGPRS